MGCCRLFLFCLERSCNPYSKGCGFARPSSVTWIWFSKIDYNGLAMRTIPKGIGYRFCYPLAIFICFNIRSFLLFIKSIVWLLYRFYSSTVWGKGDLLKLSNGKENSIRCCWSIKSCKWKNSILPLKSRNNSKKSL